MPAVPLVLALSQDPQSTKSPTTVPAWQEWQGLATAPPSKRACQGKGLLLLRHTSSDASSQDDDAEEAPAGCVDSLDAMIDGVVEAELTCSGACSMDSCACIASSDITDRSAGSSSDAPAQLLTCISAITEAADTEPLPAHVDEDMAAARSSSGDSTDSLLLPPAAAAAQQLCEAAAVAGAAPEQQTQGPAFSDAFQRLCYFGAQDEAQAAWLQQLQDEAVERSAESPFAAFAFLPL